MPATSRALHRSLKNEEGKDNMVSPQGLYSSASRHGDLIFSAGMTPRSGGEMLFAGPLAADAEPAEYRDAVRLASRNALQAIRSQLTEAEFISRIVNLIVYIATEPGFHAHSQVADFASEVLIEELGQGVVGARTAVGVATLPGNAAVELQFVAAVNSQRLD